MKNLKIEDAISSLITDLQVEFDRQGAGATVTCCNSSDSFRARNIQVDIGEYTERVRVEAQTAGYHFKPISGMWKFSIAGIYGSHVPSNLTRSRTFKTSAKRDWNFDISKAVKQFVALAEGKKNQIARRKHDNEVKDKAANVLADLKKEFPREAAMLGLATNQYGSLNIGGVCHGQETVRTILSCLKNHMPKAK